MIQGKAPGIEDIAADSETSAMGRLIFMCNAWHQRYLDEVNAKPSTRRAFALGIVVGGILSGLVFWLT